MAEFIVDDSHNRKHRTAAEEAAAARKRGSAGAPRDLTDDFEGSQYAAWDLPTAALRVAEGLPADALYTVQSRLDLSNSELADIVQISPRTLARRKKETKLQTDESERVYRINRLIEIAAHVLGSASEARAWMKEPNFALGDESPLTVARTEPGVRLVERVLAQIEHGMTT